MQEAAGPVLSDPTDVCAFALTRPFCNSVKIDFNLQKTTNN